MNVPVVTAAQMAEIDRAAAERGLTTEVLMANASRAIADAARMLSGGVAGKRIVVLAGHGNNGGDARGAATLLAAAGAEVSEALGAADLVIDGLLGFSIHGAPRAEIARIIEAANASGAPILAVDLPSGLHPDTGEPLGACIRARWTVTLGLPKTGLLTAAARPYVGELLLADIGIPAELYDRFGIDARRCFVDGNLVRVGGQTPLRSA